MDSEMTVAWPDADDAGFPEPGTRVTTRKRSPAMAAAGQPRSTSLDARSIRGQRQSTPTPARKTRSARKPTVMETVWNFEGPVGPDGRPLGLFLSGEASPPELGPWSSAPSTPPYDASSTTNHYLEPHSPSAQAANPAQQISPYPSPTEPSFPASTNDEDLTKAADGLITLFRANSSNASIKEPTSRWSRSSSYSDSDDGLQGSPTLTPFPVPSNTTFYGHPFNPAERVSARERLAVARSRSLPIMTSDSLLPEYRQLGKLDVELIVFPHFVTLPLSNVKSAGFATGLEGAFAGEQNAWQNFMEQVFA